jgi:hypothetical protein
MPLHFLEEHQRQLTNGAKGLHQHKNFDSNEAYGMI